MDKPTFAGQKKFKAQCPNCKKNHAMMIAKEVPKHGLVWIYKSTCIREMNKRMGDIFSRLLNQTIERVDGQK